MKRPLPFFKLIILSILILIVFQLTGCGAGGRDTLQETKVRSTEYNEIVELYNKMAKDFSDFANTVNNELEEEKEDFAARISSEYNKKSDGIFEKIEKIEAIEFKHDEIEKIMDDISPMIANIHEYLDSIKNIKQIDSEQILAFKEEIEALYNEIQEQSVSVTHNLEDIKQNFVVNKKED